MNDKFDELAKGLARSVTRRGALKKFGIGLVGIALATLGLANKAQAGPRKYLCHCGQKPYAGCEKYGPLGSPDFDACWSYCQFVCGN